MECLHLRDDACLRIKLLWIELFAKNGESTRQLNYSQSKEYDEKGWYFWMRCEDKLEEKRSDAFKIKGNLHKALFCRHKDCKTEYSHLWLDCHDAQGCKR